MVSERRSVKICFHGAAPMCATSEAAEKLSEQSAAAVQHHRVDSLRAGVNWPFVFCVFAEKRISGAHRLR